MCAAVQKLSRPMLLCQEMSQTLPTLPEVTAITQAQMYQGTPVDSARACSAECAMTGIVADRDDIQPNHTARCGGLGSSVLDHYHYGCNDGFRVGIEHARP